MRRRRNQTVEADEETISRKRRSLTTNMKEARTKKLRIIEMMRKGVVRFKNW